MRKLVLLALMLLAAPVIRGQIVGTVPHGRLPTSVPFLTIAPDARSAGMGDVGVASEPDANSQYWNVAKYAFAEGKAGLALSYSPWHKNLIPGIYLANAAGYYKINAKNAISSSFRYFSQGEITFFSSSGIPGTYHPFELAVDAGYSRSFSDKLSAGMALRYIHSDLTAGSISTGGKENKPGTSMAADLGIYYRNNIRVGEREAKWALGFNLSNVGPPVSYTDDAEGEPIPSNLRLGGSFQYFINHQHSLSIQGDMNKLLVPTPPVFGTDTATGDLYIVRGKNPPESVFKGMLQSFYDAPGILREDRSYSILREELYEIMLGVGLEYRYKQMLALRAGYYHEHSSKGNQKYLTLGIGGKFRIFSLDLSYLLPTNGQNSSLANTLRVMLTTEFGNPGV